jgi:mono/diheme cytochrome c family protein
MGRDERQYVALMAEGGGAFLDGGSSNTLVAFALPDIPRKALPTSARNAIAGAAASRSGTPTVGSFASAPERAKALVEKTCGTGCHTIDVVTSQRLNEEGWNVIVGNMAARGAKLSDADVKAIAEYLAKTLGQ